MREDLKEFTDRDYVFTGVFERYGLKIYRGKEVRTILIKNIKTDKGRVVADHIWFILTPEFYNLGKLVKGDKVVFISKSRSYIKGYWGRREIKNKPLEIDYRLEQPKRVKRKSNNREKGLTSLEK